jgi:hypothetical protein
LLRFFITGAGGGGASDASGLSDGSGVSAI